MKHSVLFSLSLALLGLVANLPASAGLYDKVNPANATKAKSPDKQPGKLSDVLAAAKDKNTNAGSSSVQKAVATLNVFNAPANKNADYYIYLQSASWCGPCQAEMPKIAKEYLKMKANGSVELILVSWDKDVHSAKNFVRSHNATFPVVMNSDRAVKHLPGFSTAKGIPTATIVDKNGKVIINSHGSVIMDWKTFCRAK